MTETTFYAWGIPAEPAQSTVPEKLVHNLDHTWVTDFSEPIDPNPETHMGAELQPPEHFWYCWGKPQFVASHKLLCAKGNLEIANAISPANKIPHGEFLYSTNSGSINYYGLDGVCHTVSNQVLCATGTSTQEPLRVGNAKGYPLSTFFYGIYGLNVSGWAKICDAYLQGINLPVDDFLPLLKQAVPNPEHRKSVLDIRAAARKGLAEIRIWAQENQSNEYIEKMKANNVEALIKVAVVLGPETFGRLFPFTDIHDTTWMIPPRML